MMFFLRNAGAILKRQYLPQNPIFRRFRIGGNPAAYTGDTGSLPMWQRRLVGVFGYIRNELELE